MTSKAKVKENVCRCGKAASWLSMLGRKLKGRGRDIKDGNDKRDE